ncbi:hypothetical protein FOS14_11595 [Skermania sp. ID1734]|uniref:LppM family (lipo)protein n=1 Tax=Skermania sp. ID1734 TaxID=2597516 RepID=UPI00117E0740|nr:hypothetical protein [Skermania sp. ID1734]TSD99431.1 hypothetical protein FOS14_11595 [Skermania sp. ID1734]
MNTRSRRGRRAALAALIALLPLLLSGCLRLVVDADVDSDNTVTGSIVIGVDKNLISMMPGGRDAFFKSTTSQGGCDIPGAKQTPYDQDGYTGLKCEFSNVSLADFTKAAKSEEDPLSLTREGDKFVLRGSIDLSRGSEQTDQDTPDFGAALADSDVRLTFTFPGKIESTTGTLSNDDHTVKFTTDKNGKAKIDAVAGATSDSGPVSWLQDNWYWIVLAVVVAAICVLAIVFLILRGRRKPAAAQGYGPPPGYGPPAQ